MREPEIRSHIPNDAYRDNWDRIFGPKDEDKQATETADEQSQHND